jgi:hypothetical protein
MIDKTIAKIRQAVADYMRSEGCGCCGDYDAYKIHKKKLAKLLKVRPWYDFNKYLTKEK